MEDAAAAIGDGAAFSGAERLGRRRHAFIRAACSGRAMLALPASAAIDRARAAIAHVPADAGAAGFIGGLRLTTFELAAVETAADSILASNAAPGRSLAFAAIKRPAAAILVRMTDGRAARSERGACERPASGIGTVGGVRLARIRRDPRVRLVASCL